MTVPSVAVVFRDVIARTSTIVRPSAASRALTSAAFREAKASASLNRKSWRAVSESDATL